MSGPSDYPLVRTSTSSTNATSSTNWGHHGHTLDLFLGKAGHGFENVLGSTLHKIGLGPNAALIRFEKRFMESREDWDWYRWEDENDETYKELRDDYKRLVQYMRGYVKFIVVI